MLSALPKVLVIEDDKIDFLMVHRRLRGCFEVLHAQTGAEGLEVATHTEPDCVLLDRKLPDADGLQLVRHFVGADIPVIMVTGQGNERLVVEALKAGVVDYLPKDSYTYEHLCDVVETVVMAARESKEVQQTLLNEALAFPTQKALFPQVQVVLSEALKVARTNQNIRYALHQATAANETIAGLLPGVLLWMSLDGEVFQITEGEPLPWLTYPEAFPSTLDAMLPDVLIEALYVHLEQLRRSPEVVRFDATWENENCQVSLAMTQGHRALVLLRRANTINSAHVERLAQMATLGQLTGSVVHDVNNALTAILCFTALLEEEATTEHTRQELQHLTHAAHSIQQMMQNLLDYARHESPIRHVIDLNHVVEQCAPLLSRVLRAPARLHVDLCDAPCTVLANATELERVVTNLVLNARDALLPQGGDVVISTALGGVEDEVDSVPHVRLDVSDTGCGMSPELQQKAFEPFFSTKGDNGTGMGLTTVQRIVARCSGAIALETKLGQGTTVSVRLPRCL
ncbi:MAG: hybrid sensor histidine kinase/response regulator [Myxococcota bacterium]